MSGNTELHRCTDCMFLCFIPVDENPIDCCCKNVKSWPPPTQCFVVVNKKTGSSQSAVSQRNYG